MVKLKVKISGKGQILIPKILRDKYGIEENGSVILEPTPEGLLIRGRPSPDELFARFKEHVDKIGGMGLKSSRLGDLKGVCLETEFEES